MIRLLSRLVLAAGILLAALPARGEAAGSAASPARRLSVAEAIELAKAASPRVGALQALERGAAARVRGARAERLPSVDLTAGYTRYSEIPELVIALPAAPPRTIFPSIENSWGTRLGVSIPLYTGGRLPDLIEAAGRERSAASKEIDSATADVALEAATDYWHLVTALQSERVLREALASYDAHLADARNQERFGLAAHNEVLAVQVERDRAELSRIQAASAAEAIQADLVRLLGLGPGTRLEPAEPLEATDAPPEDVEAVVAAALEARPERAALLARIEAADSRSRAARADRLPQLKFAAGYDLARPNRRILPLEDRWDDTWDASVLLSFRIFDSGRTDAAVAQRQAEADAARQDLVDLERRIRLEVTQRLLDVRTAGAEVAVAESSLLSATENERIAGERWRSGVIPSSELLDAEVARLRAGLYRTEALARLRLALARLDRAAGR